MSEQSSKSQVRSRDRVQAHGEVFTNPREVNAMLDLVKQETERIESRFLEPACGDGNFLAEILRRKLSVVKTRYGKSLSDYERYALLAVGSIYGVELLADNAQACRDRLFSILEEAYLPICKKEPTPGFLESIRFVLERNVLMGNALSMRCVDEVGEDTAEPIVFSEWSLATGDKVKRRDFRLDELLEGGAGVADGKAQAVMTLSLFGDEYLTNEGGNVHPRSEWELDAETGAWIPKPIREFPLMSIYKVGKRACDA